MELPHYGDHDMKSFLADLAASNDLCVHWMWQDAANRYGFRYRLAGAKLKIDSSDGMKHYFS